MAALTRSVGFLLSLVLRNRLVEDEFGALVVIFFIGVYIERKSNEQCNLSLRFLIGSVGVQKESEIIVSDAIKEITVL